MGDGTLTVDQLQKDMISLKDELIRHSETVSEKATQRLVKEKSESEMLLEGRTQAFAVGLEKKYEEMFNLFKDDVLRQQGERNIRFNEQYEEFESKINDDKISLNKQLAKIELNSQD